MQLTDQQLALLELHEKQLKKTVSEYLYDRIINKKNKKIRTYMLLSLQIQFWFKLTEWQKSIVKAVKEQRKNLPIKDNDYKWLLSLIKLYWIHPNELKKIIEKNFSSKINKNVGKT